jgi:ATP-binding cassette subfamily G (WHITE) protein 2
LYCWKETLPILHNVSVDAEPGNFTGIMGPSGCGKTTLLEILSCRAQGTKTGVVTINGVEASAEILGNIAGYVKQEDLLLPTATVREAIEFSARLRLPISKSKRERDISISNAIDHLDMRVKADSRIGSDEERGLSGGQRRRTSIGLELVTKPGILLLDEPTSGLDSASAKHTISILRNLARKNNRTIICTIHQPDSEIIEMMDSVIILHAGRVLYQGQPGKVREFLLGVFPKLKPDLSTKRTLDFFLDVITSADVAKTVKAVSTEDTLLPQASPSMKYPSQSPMTVHTPLLHNARPSTTCFQVADDITERWRTWPRAQLQVENLGLPEPALDLPGFWTQLGALFARSFVNRIRDQQLVLAQFVQYLFWGLFLGLIYFRRGTKGESWDDRAFAIFCFLENVVWGPALTTALIFPLERPLYNRELDGGWYQPLPYFMALTWSDFPFQVLFIGSSCAMTYWMIPLQASADRFFIFVTIILLSSITIQSLTLLASTISRTAGVATIIAEMVIPVCLMFGGFWLPPKDLPLFLRFFGYVSPFYYAYHALMHNEFIGSTIPCSPTAGPCPIGNLTVALPTPNPTNVTGQVAPDQLCVYPCLITTGKEALGYLGLEGSSILRDSMVLLGMTAALQIAIYLSLKLIRVGRST